MAPGAGKDLASGGLSPVAPSWVQNTCPPAFDDLLLLGAVGARAAATSP